MTTFETLNPKMENQSIVWEVEITPSNRVSVSFETGVDPYFDVETIVRDRYLLCRVVAWLCVRQRQANGLTPQEFDNLLDGETIDRMLVAYVGAVEQFLKFVKQEMKKNE